MNTHRRLSARLIVSATLLLPGCGMHESETTPMAHVRVFNESGELVGPIEMPKVQRSEAEWKRTLTPEQYQIARAKGTERAFTGKLLENKEEGVYTCAACGLPLFDSETKFNSGTGWPSYYQPIATENVATEPDYSHGVRTEVLCARCDSHLGHVFDDGPRPTGLRYCLNSASIAFTPRAQVATLADPAARQSAKPQAAGSTSAVLAGGCFWCTEAVFEQLDGVSDVVSGYAGDSARNANYEAVSTGSTNHAEAIRISYDPAKISYEKLLKVFFTVAHDPTQRNRQGNDVGPQYRSAIFYANEDEKRRARAVIEQLEASRTFSKPIVTTLEPLTEFHPAESYHQDYARQNPNQPYIRAQAQPKVEKVRKQFAEQVRPQ